MEVHAELTDDDSDHNRLLKKNFSWTNSDTFTNANNSLKSSQSDPLVLDTVATNVKSITSSCLKQATSQLIPRLRSQSNASQVIGKLAPLAKAMSTTSSLAHQTISTSTAIHLNIQPNVSFHRVILNHCKVIR